MKILLNLLRGIGKIWLSLTCGGAFLLWLFGWTIHLSGWLWGMGTMAVYLLMLAYHSQTIQGVDARDVIAKVRFQMLQRFIMVIISVILAMKILEPTPLSLIGSLAIMHPVLYIFQWTHRLDSDEKAHKKNRI